MRALVASLLALSARSLSCIDEDGYSAADWWLIMKLHSGLRYSYFNSSTPQQAAVTVDGATLDTYRNSLGATLQQIIDNAASTAVIMWNDEVPPLTAAEWDVWYAAQLLAERNGGKAAGAAPAPVASGTTGHTKGVLAADANGGFWLTHSMPLFPVLNESHFRWTPSTTYGQTFLCVSLTPDDVEVAASQIALVDPKPYDSRVPAALQSLYPGMQALLDGQRRTGTGSATVHGGSTSFTHYGKSGSTGIDIFEDYLQPQLGLNFFWETWRRSPAMASYCQPEYEYDSVNVNMLAWQEVDGTPIDFKYTQDHSKYGLANTSNSQQHFVCVGDMNRMSSQWTRGGGFVCFRHADVYYTLLASFSETDVC